MEADRHRRWLISVCMMVAACGMGDVASAQTTDGGDLSFELVDPKVLRVCADPRNMPFSNEKGEGIENKLAELFANKLHKKLDYVFFPQATGFVRMTLGAHRCDVIMGFPQGDDVVQGTPIPITARPMRWSRRPVADSRMSIRSRIPGSKASTSVSSPAHRRRPTWRSPG
ncbi:hypothetical protein ACVWZ4_004620 [Bradyrhizobium sp. USDA 4472]